MAVPVQNRQFALDTNVLIDLGARKGFAHAFLQSYAIRGLAVPPTVVQELTGIAFAPSHRATTFAFEALANMRAWGIVPFDLKSVWHGITEANARKLIKLRILPEDQFNDGLILIETSLARIPNLVTSDHHLLDADKSRLTTVFGDLDLPSVQIFHPKDLLRAASGR
jgi:predicted nucleic acid-binding protein